MTNKKGECNATSDHLHSVTSKKGVCVAKSPNRVITKRLTSIKLIFKSKNVWESGGGRGRVKRKFKRNIAINTEKDGFT